MPRTASILIIARTVALAGLFSLGAGRLAAQPQQAQAIKPGPPTGVALHPLNRAVAISWNAATGAVGYRVLRSTDSARVGADVTPPITALSYTDASVTLNTVYFYSVVAVYAGGVQAASRPQRVVAAQLTALATEGLAGRNQPAASSGPPPLAVAVRALDPSLQEVSWNSLRAVASTDIFRRNFTNGPWVPINKTPVKNLPYYYDSTSLNPGQYSYRVVLHYSDGTDGTGEAAFTPTLTAQPVTTLTVVQNTAEGSVGIWWKPVDKATGYRIFGPGQPATGKLVRSNIDTLTGVPAGNQTFVVSPEYLAPLPNAPKSSVALMVYRRSARYRVTINGFRVNEQTVDDPFQLDGKGDEIYIAAQVLRYQIGPSLQNYSYRDMSVVRTPVYGDVNGFTGRIQAGSASARGGIVKGDVVPANAASPSANPSPTQLPLLVWDGVLTFRQEALIVIPTVWEYDGKSEMYGYWLQNWVDKATTGMRLSNYLIRDQLANPTLVQGFIYKTVDDHFGSSLGDNGPGHDRPVGLQPGNGGQMQLNDVGLALSQERLESIFEKAGTTRLVMQWGFQDSRDVSGCGTLCGYYTLYVQVERLP